MFEIEEHPERFLAEEEVNRAIKREGIEHPVLTLFERYSSQIEGFSQGYQQVAKEYQSKYIKENFGFFADALEELGEFSLSPLETIAIWSQASEFHLPRYQMAAALATAYASAGIRKDKPHWKGVTKHLIENAEYPAGVLEDEEGVNTFKANFAELDQSLEEIEFYRLGSRVHMQDLLDAMIKGDSSAGDKLRAMSPRTNQPQMQLLGTIRENFGNGMQLVFLPLAEYQDKSQYTKPSN